MLPRTASGAVGSARRFGSRPGSFYDKSFARYRKGRCFVVNTFPFWIVSLSGLSPLTNTQKESESMAIRFHKCISRAGLSVCVCACPLIHARAIHAQNSQPQTNGDRHHGCPVTKAADAFVPPPPYRNTAIAGSSFFGTAGRAARKWAITLASGLHRRATRTQRTGSRAGSRAHASRPHPAIYISRIARIAA